MSAHGPMPRSAWIFPLLAFVLFFAAGAFGLSYTPSVAGLGFAAAVLILLFGTVFAAVHHAEVIARRTGEPYGTLVLSMAVTIIEVAVIASIMLGEVEAPALARDTVFAVIMIVCNGLVGVCILAGGLRYREQDFRTSGAGIYLSVLIVLATITLVLPNYTLAEPGPVYSVGQLEFVSGMTILLYLVFLYTQTMRHRNYFTFGEEEDEKAGVISGRMLWLSVALLLLSLFAVVLLAKKFSVVIDAAVAAAGVPPAVSGIVVAFLVLLPESLAAIAAARRNQLQRSINLALGSTLATIGLTIPAISATVIVLGKQLVLGLSPREMVLLVMTIVVSMLTFGTGRTNILSGLVHLVMFAVFLFTAFVP